MIIEGDQPLLTDLEPSICETLQNAKAPFTIMVYGNCWAVFPSWCRDRGLEPVSCPLQDIMRLMANQLVHVTGWHSFCMVQGGYAPQGKACCSMEPATGPAGLVQVTL